MPSPSRPVKGKIITPTSSTTRPADTTAYASGDLVANSTTAGSVVALSWSVTNAGDGAVEGMVRRVRMYSDDSDVTSASFRIHFFTSAPTVSAGDNSALAVTTVTNASYLGSVDVTLDRSVVNSDAQGIGVPGVGSELNFSDASTLYGLIEARAAYTPASAEVLTVVPEIHVY